MAEGCTRARATHSSLCGVAHLSRGAAEKKAEQPVARRVSNDHTSGHDTPQLLPLRYNVCMEKRK